MSEKVQIPEEICDLTNSMNMYGLEYSYDVDNKVLKIKGKIKWVNRFNDKLYITIRNKGVNIEYIESGDDAMVMFTVNNKLGTETVLNQIMLKKKPHIYYDSGCLNLMFED
jgi:DNA/RNA endonuclease YhcR with UshA esterase domain